MGTEAMGHGAVASAREGVRRRMALGAVALGVALASSGPDAARAQADSASSSSSTTLSSPNGDISLIPNSQGIERQKYNHPENRPWWISYDDCVDDDVITFSLAAGAGASNRSLEVWAGTQNCGEGRANIGTIGQCWMVARETVQGNSIAIEVPVRNVVLRRTGVAELPGPLGPEVCELSDEPNGDTISWYFMVIEGGRGDEYFAWDGGPGRTGFDVVGPAPPPAIHVGVGESQLAIDMDEPASDPTRSRYQAYCVPEGTLLGSLEQGVDAGSPDTSDAGSTFTCGQNVLQAGQRPPRSPEFECGTTDSFSGTLETTRLQDYVTYAVAVSGQDNIGNAGLISEVQCGTPTRLDDFFELCSRSGCPGGGGFCSLSPGRRAEGAGSLSLALLALAGLGWRRRMTGRSRPTPT